MAQRLLSPTSTSSMDSAATADHAPLPHSRATASASPPISTPPTSLDDEASVLSEMTKLEHTTEILEEVPVAPAAPAAQLDAAAPQSAPDAATPDGRRSARNSRKSVTTYNLQILAGTAVHTPTKYLEKHHKNVLHGSLEELAQAQTVTPAKKRTPRTKAESADPSDAVEEQLVTEAAQAVRRRTSTRATDLRKEALRNLIGVGDAVANSISGGKSLVKNALRRSASDSNLRSTGSPALAGSSKRPRTAAGTDTPDEAPEPKEYLKPKTKTWLKQGLYVGQHREFDPRLSESQNRVKKRGRKGRENKALPLPMFAGDRLLSEDPRLVFRNFKLPFDTYNPLPRKVKVDNWTKLSRSKAHVLRRVD
jgi:palmitoyltransferase ZDHHC9/14/18